MPISTSRLPLASLGIAALCLALLPGAARAQLTLSITPAQSVLLPGDSRNLAALLTNTGAETLSLIGTSLSQTGPDPTALTVDVLDFENNLPVTLGPGDTYGGTLFATLGGLAPIGEYTFTYTVDGLGSEFVSAPATVTFNRAGAGNVSAPEPSALALLSLIVLPAAWKRRRKR